MSLVFVALSYLASVNAARLRILLPQEPTTGKVRFDAVVGGSVAILAVALVMSGGARSLLDALSITDEMWRIATGLIVIAAGLRYVAFPATGEEPALGGRLSALVPVAFPLLLTPELFVLTVAFTVDESVGLAMAGVAIAFGVLLFISLVRRGSRPERWLAGARFHAALLVVVGVAIVIEGIRDV
ncbi:MAG: hypothetical protein ACE5GC_01690 [Acidimicrobiia bacterium]